MPEPQTLVPSSTEITLQYGVRNKYNDNIFDRREEMRFNIPGCINMQQLPKIIEASGYNISRLDITALEITTKGK